jgi:hypothetical protein
LSAQDLVVSLFLHTSVTSSIVLQHFQTTTDSFFFPVPPKLFFYSNTPNFKIISLILLFWEGRFTSMAEPTPALSKWHGGIETSAIDLHRLIHQTIGRVKVHGRHASHKIMGYKYSKPPKNIIFLFSFSLFSFPLSRSLFSHSLKNINICSSPNQKPPLRPPPTTTGTLKTQKHQI